MAYGLQIFNSSGQLVIDTSSIMLFFKGTYSGTITGNSDYSFTIPAPNAKTSDVVVEAGEVQDYYSLDITIPSDGTINVAVRVYEQPASGSSPYKLLLFSKGGT